MNSNGRPLIPYLRQSRAKERTISIDEQRRDVRRWAEAAGATLAAVTGPSDAELRDLLEQQDDRPGDGVQMFVFAKGDAVPADHPAVLAFPHLFDPAEE